MGLTLVGNDLTAGSPTVTLLRLLLLLDTSISPRPTRSKSSRSWYNTTIISRNKSSMKLKKTGAYPKEMKIGILTIL